MTGLYSVKFFDPKNSSSFTVERRDVIAHNAEEAIRRAKPKRTLKQYRVHSVECLGMADAD